MTPDKSRVVSASADRTLTVWDLKTGQSLVSLENHQARVVAVAVTRDNRHIVSASADRTLKVWDLSAGTLVDSFTGDHPFSRVGISETGRILATAGFGVYELKLRAPDARPAAPELRRDTERKVTSIPLDVRWMEAKKGDEEATTCGDGHSSSVIRMLLGGGGEPVAQILIQKGWRPRCNEDVAFYWVATGATEPIAPHWDEVCQTLLRAMQDANPDLLEQPGSGDRRDRTSASMDIDAFRSLDQLWTSGRDTCQGVELRTKLTEILRRTARPELAAAFEKSEHMKDVGAAWTKEHTSTEPSQGSGYQRRMIVRRRRRRCAAPDTPIATPEGERPIAALHIGDLVYSVDGEAIRAVPVARVERAPVTSHQVVRVMLQGGGALEMSPGHPTADGRTFADLVRGSPLDAQHRVTSAELVPYRHDATYDILPASSSGTYFAAGALVGSTLGGAPDAACVALDE